MEKDRVKVFDVTLREGEQTPGLFFSPVEKVYLAKRMIEAGIRHIEVGVVGIAEDEAAFRAMADEGLTEKAEISLTLLPCAELCDKALDSDIKFLNIVFPVTACLAETFKFTVDSYIKYHIPWIEILRETGKQIRMALADASRFVLLNQEQKIAHDKSVIEKNLANLIELIRSFHQHGVEGFIFTDTVGLLTPSEVSLCMNRLRREFPGVEWGAHFHNDFGLATANTLTAYEQGATLLQGSFNFLGERCGIASPAEIIAALRYLYGVEVNIDLAKIRRLTYEIEEMAGMVINERQPVIGRGLYWYETATPVLTMLNREAGIFETVPAEGAGAERKILIGKHTSRKLFKLYQDYGIIGQDHELKALKEQAIRRRAGKLSELKKIIQNYHREVEESCCLLPVSLPNPPSATDFSEDAASETENLLNKPAKKAFPRKAALVVNNS